MKRVPIRTDRILGGIPKFAENSRRPGVKLIRLWNEKVAAGLGVVERVDVLLFHQRGRFKWEKLGLDYTLQDVRPPSPEMVETMCQLFRDEGLPAY